MSKLISLDEMSVAQMQGYTKEAIVSYNRMLKRKHVDALLITITSNNLIVIKGGKNLFDSSKKFDKLLQNKGLGHTSRN
jgi:hypothetical protein